MKKYFVWTLLILTFVVLSGCTKKPVTVTEKGVTDRSQSVVSIEIK